MRRFVSAVEIQRTKETSYVKRDGVTFMSGKRREENTECLVRKSMLTGVDPERVSH